ncbi:MAG TPA: glycosyltransferase family A protein [Methylomirabilota bacterium]
MWRLWRTEGTEAVRDRARDRVRGLLGAGELEARVEALEARFAAVSTWTVMSWIEQAALADTPLVSVVLPTRNRSTLLPRAVASVRAQIYSNWELIVVDDGSTDDTPATIERLRGELGEDRVRSSRIAHGGVCAARNHALAQAKGSLTTYLDDDNVMHPLWLKAVVWAFSQRPEVDVLYGGIVVDDVRRVLRRDAGDLPSYHLYPFDRRHLIESNLADIGAIAHRSGLPEAHFDESLREMGDWDLLVRLTRAKAPLVLPAIACFYSTVEPDRLSGGQTHDADFARVQRKARE